MTSFEERFWSRVNKTDNCWVWTARVNFKGYGQIPVPRGLTSIAGANQFAHRISWFLAYGPVPDGLCVLHRCDNPPCVRPDHLWLGTRADNNEDMRRKGRTHRPAWIGTDVPTAKLTEQQVVEVRALHASGMKQAGIANRYGVTPGTINAVVRRRTWRHVA